MKKCPYCQEMIPADSVLCPICSENLSLETPESEKLMDSPQPTHASHNVSTPPPLPPQESVTNYEQQPEDDEEFYYEEQRSSRKWIIPVVILIILAFATAAYYFLVVKNDDTPITDPSLLHKQTTIDSKASDYMSMEESGPSEEEIMQDEISAIINFVYSMYANDDYVDRSNCFAKESKKLYAKVSDSNDGDMPILDWDPFIDAQDYYNFSYRLESVERKSENKAIAKVKYKNSYGSYVKNFTFIKENEEWKIDTFDGDSYGDFKRWMQNAVAEYATPVSSCSYARPVDLGLSVNWANINLGAASEESYGDYFAWTKADVATQYWGSSWRLPTKEELEELKNYCSWTWTNIQGIYGYRITGPNGNSIFLPAAGYFDGSSLMSANSFGSYMSSDGNSSVCYRLSFNSTKSNVRTDHSYQRRTVRPVSTNW